MMIRMMMVAGVTAKVGVTVQGPQGLLVAMAFMRLVLGVAGILFVGVGMDAENRVC